jgi:hypothetical protein
MRQKTNKTKQNAMLSFKNMSFEFGGTKFLYKIISQFTRKELLPEREYLVTAVHRRQDPDVPVQHRSA